MEIMINMKAVELSSYLCNLPKLQNESKSNFNDVFYFGEDWRIRFNIDTVKKSEIYYLADKLYEIDVFVEVGNIHHYSQSNHHNGVIDKWVEADMKYYFYNEYGEKVYLLDVVNHERASEFILVDYLSKVVSDGGGESEC